MALRGYIAMPGKEEGGLYKMANSPHPVCDNEEEAQEMAKAMKTKKFAAPQVIEVEYSDPRVGDAMLTLENWKEIGLPEGFAEEMEYVLKGEAE